MKDGEIAVTTAHHNAFTHHNGFVSLFDFGPTAVNCLASLNVENMMRWLNGTELGSSPVAIWLEADVDKMGVSSNACG